LLVKLLSQRTSCNADQPAAESLVRVAGFKSSYQPHLQSGRNLTALYKSGVSRQQQSGTAGGHHHHSATDTGNLFVNFSTNVASTQSQTSKASTNLTARVSQRHTATQRRLRIRHAHQEELVHSHTRRPRKIASACYQVNLRLVDLLRLIDRKFLLRPRMRPVVTPASTARSLVAYTAASSIAAHAQAVPGWRANRPLLPASVSRTHAAAWCGCTSADSPRRTAMRLTMRPTLASWSIVPDLPKRRRFAQSAQLQVDEQRKRRISLAVARRSQAGRPLREIRANRLRRRISQRHVALLLALAAHQNRLIGPVNVFEVQPRQLRISDAAT